MEKKGLQGQEQYTHLQKKVINRLTEIEQEDSDRCASCGGEDCACCEYYHDRQKWQSPDELFADDDDSLFGYDPADHYDFYCEECGIWVDEWCDECEKCVDCCDCEKRERK